MVMETPGLHGPDAIPLFSKPAWGSRDRGSQPWRRDTTLFDYWNYSLHNNQPWKWNSAAEWNAPPTWALDTRTSIWSGLRSTPTNEKHHCCNGSVSTKNFSIPVCMGQDTGTHRWRKQLNEHKRKSWSFETKKSSKRSSSLVTSCIPWIVYV